MKSVAVISIVALLFFSCDQHADDIEIKDKENTIYVRSLESETGNPQNELDWDGKYSGVNPCEDCDGLEMNVIIYPDHTYELITLHQGLQKTKQQIQGSFSWDDTGNIIKLNNDEGYKFQVKEDGILLLNGDDEVSTNFKLTKND